MFKITQGNFKLVTNSIQLFAVLNNPIIKFNIEMWKIYKLWTVSSKYVFKWNYLNTYWNSENSFLWMYMHTLCVLCKRFYLDKVWKTNLRTYIKVRKYLLQAYVWKKVIQIIFYRLCVCNKHIVTFTYISKSIFHYIFHFNYIIVPRNIHITTRI